MNFHVPSAGISKVYAVRQLGASDVASIERTSDQKGIEARRALNVEQVEGCPSDMMTPAQAYAYAVRTGQDVHHTLHYTIERKQPPKNAQKQPALYQPGGVDTERGGSYAQRLYASATSARSSSSLVDTKVVRSQSADKSKAGSTSPVADSGQSHLVQHNRNGSRSPSLFNTDPPSSQPFNAADFYSSGVPRHDIRPIRACRSGVLRPNMLIPVGHRVESPPLSAPPAPAPTSIATGPRVQLSLSPPSHLLAESPAPRSRSSLEVPSNRFWERPTNHDVHVIPGLSPPNSATNEWTSRYTGTIVHFTALPISDRPADQVESLLNPSPSDPRLVEGDTRQVTPSPTIVDPQSHSAPDDIAQPICFEDM